MSFKYSSEYFRELTASVIAKEKTGFWSDWTPEEQEMYLKDDWKGFSKSRRYSEAEIAEYEKWRKMAIDGAKSGFKPFNDIVDLAFNAALKNIYMDKRNEINKSSICHEWQKGVI